MEYQNCDLDSKIFLNSLFSEPNARPLRNFKPIVSYTIDDESETDELNIVHDSKDFNELNTLPYEESTGSELSNISYKSPTSKRPRDFDDKSDGVMDTSPRRKVSRTLSEFGQTISTVASAEEFQQSSNSSLDEVWRIIEELRRETAKLEYRTTSLEKLLYDPEVDATFSCVLVRTSTSEIRPVESAVPTSTSNIPNIAINFPIGTKTDLDELENNLKDAEFKKNILFYIDCTYGDDMPTKDAVPKIMKRMFHPELLAEFTWTGKSQKGKKKHAFKLYDKIQETILESLMKIDKAYNIDRLQKEIKYNVLKYAYKVGK